MERIIGHLDLDYFYAQVEEIEDPSIKTRPIVVCVFSGRTEDSGVVSTANYVARALGVKSGMPISVAKRRLEGKGPVIIKMEHAKYEVVSERVMRLIEDQVDVLEKTGIDEAFFDLTKPSGGDYEIARSMAEAIKKSLRDDEGLSCSIGLGKSKAVAKICSDMSKPGGLILVSSDATRAFLAPLPVTKLSGVGPKTAAILESHGITKIGDLAEAQVPSLEGRLGRKFATYLFLASTGSDEDPVVANQEPSQFSRVVTLKRDTRDPQEVIQQLKEPVEDLHQKLTTTGKSFRTLSAIGILTDLTIRTKNKTFDIPVNNLSMIRENALALFGELSESIGKDFRRVGLRVSDLSSSADQKSLSEFLGSPSDRMDQEERERLKLEAAPFTRHGRKFEKAIDAVLAGGVKECVFLPSGRKVYTVLGTLGDEFIDPEKPYCSCSHFFFKVRSGRDELCYHLLSYEIAASTRRVESITFSDEEYGMYLRAMAQDVFDVLSKSSSP